MKLFTLILTLFICSVTNAATYYISPTGNDVSGTGTSANPWRTLYKATSTVINSGDIIHVNAGIYTETQTSFLRVGVSIEGAGIDISIIRSNITGQWSELLSLNSPQNTNGAQSISGVTLDGQYVSETNNRTWIAIWVNGRSNVIIHHCKIINFRDRGVIFDGNDVTDPVMDPGNHATGNKFHDNTVLNSAAGTGAYGGGLLNIGGQLGMEIYNNTMIQDQRVAYRNGWPLKYWDNGWLRGVKIYNNTLVKAPYQGSYPGENGDWDFAIEFFNIQGIEIYNNNIQGSIDLNYNRKGSYNFCAWIHHNNINHATPNPNFESGIILEFRTESVLIENNTFNNVSSGVQFNTRTVNQNGGYPNPGGGTPPGGFSQLKDNIIRNNLFTNVYQGNGVGTGCGICVISESGNDPQIQNLDIYNNTIVAKAGDAPYLGLDFTSGENGNATGVNIRNNIVQGFQDRWLRGSSPTTNMSNVVVTHNDAFGNGGNTPLWPGGNPTSYTYNNNISLNPLFVSILNFLLLPLSPCINTGVNVGLPYNGSAPDMGYAEYGGPASTPPTPPVVGTITQPTCTVATGSVDLSGLPASGTWTLTRSPGAVVTTGTGTTTTITGLPAGTFTYTVTDAIGTSTPSANIVINTQPATPAAPTVGTITPPTCALATGSVVLNGLPASGTWTLTRTPGTVTTTGTGTTRTITGLATGTYTYTVTNAAGCISVSSGNIVINTQPTAPSAPIVGTITQPTCAVATGSVALSGLPVSGTWTLTLSPGGTTTTGTGTTTNITGLNPGTYTYTVTNAAGCISAASSNIVITATATPSAPTVGTITQPTCAVATGSVALSGLPASGTWTLTVSPGGTTTTGTGATTTISGLATGTYTYTVTNAAGCTSAASANVAINAQPASPTVPVVGTITQPTCAVATGSVVLSGLPASGTWTLTRTPGAVNITGTGTTTTIAGLNPGTYTYTVTNAGGCTSTSSANVVINAAASAPAAPTVGTVTQPTCAVATGSVVLNGLPATGTWTLTAIPGGATTTGTGTTTTISGLIPGTYAYTVTNAAGCTSTTSANVVITATSTPSAPAIGTITQPTCAVATGSVALSGLPASGTWTLTRTPGAVTTTGTGTTTTISGLAAGTYTYTVTNAAGCTSVASGNIVINNQASTPTVPIVGTITQPTCAVATGSVALSGLPASGTWTLTRTPGAVNITGTGSTTTIAGLNPGNYTYTVTNAGGCTSTSSANVVITPQASSPAAPTVGTITQPTCAVATGSVVLNGLPASGTWTLTRTPGAITTTGTGTSTTITGLAAGTYTYTVTNAAGCISIGSANIGINAQTATPAAPTVGTIIQPACTIATGSVTLTGLPATGTWTLTRTPGAVNISGTGTTITITGLATGTYSYTVTSAAGCLSASSANIVMNAQPATPTAPIVGTIVQPTCAVATGSVTLSGLPASGTWTVTRTPGAVNITGTGTTTTIAGLNPGNYTYTVTNAGGCTSAASGNVLITAQASSPAAPTVGTIIQPTCAVATGSVVLNGLPAVGTWTLTRTPGAITTTGTGTSTTITALAAGTYTYTVTNASGCISVGSANIVINAQPATPAAPTIGTVTQPACTVATGSVVLTGLPATGTWTLTTNPGGTTSGTGTTTTVTGLATGSYTFVVTSAAGCASPLSASVVINAQPATPTTPIVGTIIQPTPTVLTGSVELSGLPATGTWTLTRTPGAVNISGTGTTTTIAGLAPGVYTYTVTNSVGCTSAPSGNVVINGGPSNIAPDAHAGTDQTITLPTNTVIVSGSGTDADGIIVAYAWTKISGPGTGTITNPGTAATSITGLALGVYEFELIVTDNLGAIGRDTLQVTVNNSINLPPNAFAGGDQVIVAASMTAPTSTTIAGTGFDADGTVVAYNWTKIAGPAAGSVTTPGSAASPVSGLAIGVYHFELMVTDNLGATGRDTMQITIIAPPNTLPVANAGPDQTIVMPANAATLSGSGVDTDGTIVAYNWVQVSGPSNNVLFSTTTAVTYLNNLVPGTYEFELTVTDNRGGTAKDNVLVIVSALPVASIHVNSAGIFPNPVVDFGNLKLTSAIANAKLQVKITDMNGKIVFIKEPTTNQFDLTEKINMANLVKGLYIITVRFADGEMATLKAVKQ
ncbi:MAG TPA: T9SS type A sorting domain-containing protein [Ferruginibacter sp.]|nr:T9SS type A sorting domain-containing protein [Ferruginibacter sp.]